MVYHRVVVKENGMAIKYLVKGQDLDSGLVSDLEETMFWLFVDGDAKAGAIDARLTKAIKAAEWPESYKEEFELAYAVIAANEHLAEIGKVA
jgi:hypothetical protein